MHGNQQQQIINITYQTDSSLRVAGGRLAIAAAGLAGAQVESGPGPRVARCTFLARQSLKY